MADMGLGDAIESSLTKATRVAWHVETKAFDKIRGPPEMLTPDDDLQALDNTAFLKDGKWTAEFVISIFDRRYENKSHKLAEEIMSLLKVETEEVHWRRIEYFVAVPRENICVNLLQDGGTQVFQVGPTYPNGIMSQEIAFPDEGKTQVQGDRITFNVVTPPDFPEHHDLTTIFAQETGWGIISGTLSLVLYIISDIDDTIKISEVLNRKKLLRHTFIDQHGTPVAGMPDLYRSLVTRLSNPTFFYLSASPWQLYIFLLDFVRTNYPFGQIILRDMSYLELWSFIASLTIGTREFKEFEMDKIHRWFPHKQWLCIGDSTQKDPEAYGTM